MELALLAGQAVVSEADELSRPVRKLEIHFSDKGVNQAQLKTNCCAGGGKLHLAQYAHHG
jgi:hypothetical protein